MSLVHLLRKVAPSPRILRLATYLGCVSFLLAVVGARMLHAREKETLFEIGRRISGLAELTTDAEVVAVNGQRFHLARVHEDASIKDVLDRVERYCSDHQGPMTRMLDEWLAARHAASGYSNAPARRAIVREEAGNKGVVVCSVNETGRPSGPLEAALRGLLSASDLQGFGSAIYAFAERAGEATRVTTIWTDTGLRLERLFPNDGDVAGEDSDFLPRPPSARRTFAATAEGMRFALRIYESDWMAQDIRRFYADSMDRMGARAVGKNAEYDSVAYVHDGGRLAIVSLSELEGHTYVTLTESTQSEARASVSAGGPASAINRDDGANE